MNILELFLLALGLSLDAAAVAVGLGLLAAGAAAAQPGRPPRGGYAVPTGLYFGGFQGLMPLAGWWAATQLARHVNVTRFSHWVAFGLLCVLGVRMVWEGYKAHRANPEQPGGLSAVAGHRQLLLLAIATSIDALAVGVSLAWLDVRILPAAALIAGVTFVLSTAGVLVGQAVGTRFGHLSSRATILGGLILIGMGVRMLLAG